MQSGFKHFIETVEDLNLQNKKVILMFGPSRCGKGTSALSLLGFKMKLIDVEEKLDDNPDHFLKETASTSVMAPVKNG